MHSKNSAQIKTIIFDLGKVIVDFDHMQICCRLSRHCPHEPEMIYDTIFTSGLENRFDRGLISPENFYGSVREALSLNINIDRFKEIWENIFTLIPGIDGLLIRLKARYRLLCLSNTNVWHFEYCREKFPVLKNFNGFILSYQVGESKPSRAIFNAALDSAGALPSECIYIDDVPQYVEAARQLGMHGISFNTVEKLKQELHDLKA